MVGREGVRRYKIYALNNFLSLQYSIVSCYHDAGNLGLENLLILYKPCGYM